MRDRGKNMREEVLFFARWGISFKLMAFKIHMCDIEDRLGRMARPPQCNETVSGVHRDRILDMKQFARHVLAMLAISLFIGFLVVIAFWLSVSMNGTAYAVWILPWIMVPALMAPIVLVGCGIRLLGGRDRTRMGVVCVACIIYPTVCFLSCRVGFDIRYEAFASLAERSEPLVEAIQAFQAKKGHPPDKLEDLVPEFLPEVPGTGMGSCPDYLYRVGPDAEAYDDNPWVLVVNAGFGTNFDLFLYFPDGNYPERGYSGWLEKVGDWAYVHE